MSQAGAWVWVVTAGLLLAWLGARAGPGARTEAQAAADSPTPATVPAAAGHVTATGRTITGQVVDAAGKPIGGARVSQAERKPGAEIDGSTRTDGDGCFSLFAVERGSRVLVVVTPGYGPQAVYIDSEAQDTPVRIHLGPGRTIRGQVVDMGGNPVAGADVLVGPWREQMLLRWSTTTDIHGQFEWADAPEEQIELLAAKRGYDECPEVTSAADSGPVTLKVIAIQRFTGRVTDGVTGAAIAGAEVLAGTTRPEWRPPLDFDWNPEPIATTLKNGEYSGVKVLASPDDQNRMSAIRVQAPGHAPAQSALFRAGAGEVRLDIKLQPAPAITGHVVWADGSAAAGVEVVLGTQRPNGITIRDGQLNGRPYGVQVTRSGQAGQFTFWPQDSRYVVVAMDQAGYGVLSDQQLAKSPVLKLEPWGRVEMDYQSSQAPTPAQMLLAVRDWDWNEPAPTRQRIFFISSATIDKAGRPGRLVFDHVPATHGRTLQLMRFDRGREYLSVPGPPGVPEIHAGKTVSARVGGPGVVLGHVELPAQPGPPSGGSSIIRIAEKPKTPALDQQARSHLLTFQADIHADGSFLVDALPPGDYEYVIEAAPAAVASGTLHIPEGVGPAVDLGRVQLIPIATPAIGSIAAAFDLAKVGGGRLKLSDLRGHLALLCFWAPSEPIVVSALPHLKAVTERYGRDTRLMLVGIDRRLLNPTRREVEPGPDERCTFGVEGFLQMGDAQALAPLGGLTKFDSFTCVLIDGGGKVLAVESDEQAIIKAVDAALGGKAR